MPSLFEMKCRELPAGTPALGRARIDALLKEVPGWSYDGKVITKTYSFKNYYETIAFVNAVAWVVHREDRGASGALSRREAGLLLAQHGRGPSPQERARGVGNRLHGEERGTRAP